MSPNRRGRQRAAGLACCLLFSGCSLPVVPMSDLAGSLALDLAVTTTPESTASLDIEYGEGSVTAHDTVVLSCEDAGAAWEIEPSQATTPDTGAGIGCRLNGEWTMAEIATGDLPGATLTRTGDLLSLTLDLPGGLTHRVESAQVNLEFPGEVVHASGSGAVDGTRVTWSAVPDLTTGIRATGYTYPLGMRVLPWLIGFLTVSGAGAAAWLLSRGRLLVASPAEVTQRTPEGPVLHPGPDQHGG